MKSYLYVRLVDIARARKLRLLAHYLRKDDVLLKQEHMQLFRLLGIVRILITTTGTFDTVKRTVQQ